MINIRVIATDFDGTLARSGIVDAETWQALERFRADGGRLVLVTGRELPELFEVCKRLDLFEWVVAENGAVLYDPASRTERVLASPPPEALVSLLRRKEVYPLSVGRSVIATLETHAETVYAALGALGLRNVVIKNKESIMILPHDISKESGLAVALEAMGCVWEETAGIGDGENDVGFLSRSGVSVALANAVSELKEIATVVTVEPSGAGVVEFLEMLENSRRNA